MTETAKGKTVGRPATGRTPVKSFRPPASLWQEAEAKAQLEGRTMTEVLISLLHRYTSTPAKPSPPPN